VLERDKHSDDSSSNFPPSTQTRLMKDIIAELVALMKTPDDSSFSTQSQPTQVMSQQSEASNGDMGGSRPVLVPLRLDTTASDVERRAQAEWDLYIQLTMKANADRTHPMAHTRHCGVLILALWHGGGRYRIAYPSLLCLQGSTCAHRPLQHHHSVSSPKEASL
jgi:hypothetical protein